MIRRLGIALFAFVPLILVASVSSLGPRARGADQIVKIGAIVPLTGVAAPSGQGMKAAIELAAKIINDGHRELTPLPLTSSPGLPGLGGAKLEVIFADSQGKPDVGQTQAIKLIEQDHVVALFGSYQSSVTKTTSAAAERYGIPFVCGDSVLAELTERGYKTFFRVTPAIAEFARLYVEFFDDVRKTQHKNIKTIAVVHENTDYGTSVGEALEAVVKGTPYQVVANIPYTASTTDVTAEVNQLKAKKPDVVIFASYTSDSILYAQTMNNLGFKPAAIIGDDSGFVDGAFVKNAGPLMEGAMSRSSWAPPKRGTNAFRVNEMYKAMGYDFDTYESAARDIQGFWVLADAINRAKSTEPAAIIKALQATNLSATQVILPYKGVKFDAKGQNVEGAGGMEQIIDGKYVFVWPAKFAQAKLVWPFVGKK